MGEGHEGCAKDEEFEDKLEAEGSREIRMAV